MKTYTITGEKQLPESELEIAVLIDYENLIPHRKAALKKMSETASVSGFRKGHVPEKILIEKVGEIYLLEDAAYNAIEETLPDIVIEKDLKFIGRPVISITKLAPGNPLEFTVVFSVLPEVKLPDYKKIASAVNARKTEEPSVTEKEVEDFILNIRKSIGSGNDGNASSDSQKKSETVPELTDTFIKKLGNFKNMEDFMAKVRENILADKALRAKEKKRISIADAILAEIKIITPKVLIENEIAKMLGRFHDDLAKMGMKMEDYLKQVKKTEENIRSECRQDAKKRGNLQLVLNAVAQAEKITAPKEEVEKEVKHLLEHYKDLDLKRVHDHVTDLITNEKVFEFLETQ